MPHYYGAAGTSNAGQHEWRPYSRHPLVLRRGYGVRLARVMLHELRWRREPRQWVLRVTAGMLVVVVHVVVLAMMTLVRPPGQGSGTGDAGSSAVSVRLIQAAAPASAPAPPPIVLPQRKVVRAAHPAAQRAPTAALPPVTLQAPPPKVAVAPATPRIAAVRPVLAPTAHIKPATAEAPPIALPPQKRVVAEPSHQPLPVPEMPAIKLAPAQPVPSTVSPVPVPEVAPDLAPATPPAQGRVAAASPVVPVAPAPVQATPLPLPQVTMTPPIEEVTPAPAAPPAVVLPVPRVASPLAVPSVAVTPAATASVPAASSSSAMGKAAPRAVAGATPKAAAQARTPAAAGSSWANPRGQFNPRVGRTGNADAMARHPGQGEGSVRLVPRGNSDVMTRNADRLGYTPTIFDQYWAPQNESALDTFLRHFIEKLSVAHTFHLAPGVRVRCVLGPLAIFLVCGGADGPRPPSPKSNDPRLDMAPARSLAPRPATPASVRAAAAPTTSFDQVVQCEAAKVAGRLPPPGCLGAPAAGASTRTH